MHSLLNNVKIHLMNKRIAIAFFVTLIIPTIVFAQQSGTMLQLPQFVSTTTPYSSLMPSITQQIYGKPLYITATTTTATSTFRGSVDIAGNLNVQGNSVLHAYIFSTGNTTIGGTLTASNFVGTSTANNTFAGKVGIGITPVTPLHVYKYGAGILNLLTLENNYSAAEGGEGIYFKGFYKHALISTYENASARVGGNLRLQTYSDDSTIGTGITLTKADNVGIGTVNPKSWTKTEIVTTANTGFLAGYDAGGGVLVGYAGNTIQGRTGADQAANGNLILNPYAGNVGIGTTSPLSQLEIKGTASTGAPASTGANIAVLDTGGSPGNGGGITFGTDNQPAGFAGIKGYLTDEVGNQTAGDLVFYNRKARTDATLTENMRIKASGYVGIGTSTPNAKTNIYTANSSAPNLSLETAGADAHMSLKSYAAGGRNYLIGSGATGSSVPGFYVYDSTAPAARLVINPTGNIGIGTTSPLRELVLYKAASPVFQIANSTSGSGLTDGTYLNQYNNDFYMINQESATMNFGTSNSTDITILSGGNVGIGTTTPDQKLTVTGVIKSETANGFQNKVNGSYAGFSGVSYSNTDWQGTYFTALRNRGTISAPLAVQAEDIMFSLYGAAYDGVGALTGVESAKINMTVDGAVSSGVVPSRISMFTMNTAGAETERLTIKNTGNVGIGTTSPNGKFVVNGTAGQLGTVIGDAGFGTAYAGLSVQGSLTSTNFSLLGDATNLVINRPAGGDIMFRENNNPGNMIIKSGGNVGIGTTTPTEKLSVAGSVNTSVLSLNNVLLNGGGSSLSEYQSILFNNYSPTGVPKAEIRSYANASFDNNSALAFWTNLHGGSYTEKMRILGNGNVGIGTTTPKTKLHFSGDASASSINTALRISDTANSLSRDWAIGSGSGINYGALAFLVGASQNSDPLSGGTEALTIFRTGNVGIGTTTPYAKLSVNSGASTGVVLDLSTTTGKTVMKVDAYGHKYYGGNTPTLTACTGCTVMGNDNVMRITVGGTSVTTATITFANAWESSPVCFANEADSNLAPNEGLTASTTPTTLYVTHTIATTNEVWEVSCQGIIGATY